MQSTSVILSQLITQNSDNARELLANKLKIILLADVEANKALLNKLIQTLASLPDQKIIDQFANVIESLGNTPIIFEECFKDMLLPNLCRLTAENIAVMCNNISKFVRNLDGVQSSQFRTRFAFLQVLHFPLEFPQILNRISSGVVKKEASMRSALLHCLSQLFPRGLKEFLETVSNFSQDSISWKTIQAIFSNSKLIDIFEHIRIADELYMLDDGAVDFINFLILNEILIDEDVIHAIKFASPMEGVVDYYKDYIKNVIRDHVDFPTSDYYLLIKWLAATKCYHSSSPINLQLKKLSHIIKNLGRFLLNVLDNFPPIYTQKSLFHDIVQHIYLVDEPNDEFFTKIEEILHNYVYRSLNKNTFIEQYEKLLAVYHVDPTAENQKLLRVIISKLIDHDDLPLNDLQSLILSAVQKAELLNLAGLSDIAFKRKILSYFAPCDQLSGEDVERLFETKIIITSKRFSANNDAPNNTYQYIGVYSYPHGSTTRERTLLELRLGGLYFFLLTSQFFHKFAVENQPHAGQKFLHGRFDYSQNFCDRLSNVRFINILQFIIIPRLTQLEDIFKSAVLIKTFFARAHFTQHPSLQLVRNALYSAFNNIAISYSQSQHSFISADFSNSSIYDFIDAIKMKYRVDIDILSVDRIREEEFLILARKPEYQQWLNTLLARLTIDTLYHSYVKDKEKISSAAQTPAPKFADPKRVTEKERETMLKYDPCLVAIQHYFLTHFNFQFIDEKERTENLLRLISTAEINFPLLTSRLIQPLASTFYFYCDDWKEIEQQINELKQRFPINPNDIPQKQPFVDKKIFFRRCNVRMPYEVELSSLIANSDYFKPVTLVIKDIPRSPINLPDWQDQPLILVQCGFNSDDKRRVFVGAKNNFYSNLLKGARIDLNAPQETIEEIIKAQIKTSDKNAKVKFLSIKEMEDKCQEIYLRYKGLIPDISTTELANQFYVWCKEKYVSKQQQLHLNTALETFFLECNIHECVRNSLRNCLVKYKLSDLTVENFIKSVPAAIKNPKKSKPYKDNLVRIIPHNEILMQLDLNDAHNKDKLAGVAFCGFSRRSIQNVIDLADAATEIFGQKDIQIYYYDYKLGQFIAFSRERLLAIKDSLPETFYPENPNPQHAALASGDIKLNASQPGMGPTPKNPGTPSMPQLAGFNPPRAQVLPNPLPLTGVATPGLFFPVSAVTPIHHIPVLGTIPSTAQRGGSIIPGSFPAAVSTQSSNNFQDTPTIFLQNLINMGYTVVPLQSRPPAERDKHQAMVKDLPGIRKYLIENNLCIVSFADLLATAALVSLPNPVVNPAVNPGAISSSHTTLAALPPVAISTSANVPPSAAVPTPVNVSLSTVAPFLPAAASIKLPLQPVRENKGEKRPPSPTSAQQGPAKVATTSEPAASESRGVPKGKR